MNFHKNLLPNIILSVILISIVVLCIGCTIRAEASEPIQDQEQTPAPSAKLAEPAPLQTASLLAEKGISFVETEDPDELKQLIESCKAHKESAHIMAEAARALGYVENHPIIVAAKREWYEADDMQVHYESIYNEVFNATWAARMEEYPAATTIWLYLKDLGYNDYVCAGILGNMMIEVGGRTLDIQYWLYSPDKGFYGMCQWSKSHYSEIHGADLQAQCDFLASNIKFEIDTFGYVYKRNFDYSAFLALENERDAALAFAQIYERCGTGTYSLRQNCAEVAYDYFVN